MFLHGILSGFNPVVTRYEPGTMFYGLYCWVPPFVLLQHITLTLLVISTKVLKHSAAIWDHILKSVVWKQPGAYKVYSYTPCGCYNGKQTHSLMSRHSGTLMNSYRQEADIQRKQRNSLFPRGSHSDLTLHCQRFDPEFKLDHTTDSVPHQNKSHRMSKRVRWRCCPLSML